MTRTAKKVSPHDGGCWYCKTDSDIDELWFSNEFDAYFHPSCLIHALMLDPTDGEVIIFAREFK